MVVLAAHEIGGFSPAEVEDRAAGHGEEQAETARDASGPGEARTAIKTKAVAASAKNVFRFPFSHFQISSRFINLHTS